MLYDRATISGNARITKDGYFVADALVARANNIQDYYAYELGLADREPNEKVRVFRPESEVFHKDALASLAHRPVTLDHPKESVKATNWKELSVGDVGGDIARDGEFIRVPLKIMDSSAIESIKSNRREFSLGYTADIEPQSGVFNDQAYDFVVKNIRYNHLAAVSKARGGEELRIIDERTIEEPVQGKSKMKLTIGDAQDVDLSDGAAVAVAVGALNTKLADAERSVGEITAQLADANTKIEAKDGKIAALEAELADAKVTPEKLQMLADARAELIGKAKVIAPSVVVDGKSDADIRRDVVKARLGDAVVNMSDAAIEGAFTAFTADNKPQPLGNPTIVDGKSVSDSAYEKSVNDLNAWRAA